MSRNGCYNRPLLKHHALVQMGWHNSNGERYPTLRTIPDPMSKECQYQKLKKDDPKCIGCKHLEGELK